MQRVDDALSRGVDIGMDFVPYALGNTTATQLYPPWANLGGTQALLERLQELEDAGAHPARCGAVASRLAALGGRVLAG